MIDLRLECLITFALSGILIKQQQRNHILQIQEYAIQPFKLVHAYHIWKQHIWKTLDVYKEEKALLHARRRLGYKQIQHELPWRITSPELTSNECDYLLDSLSRQLAFTPDLASSP